MIWNFEYLIVFISAPGVLPGQNDRYRIQPWKVNEKKHRYKNTPFSPISDVSQENSRSKLKKTYINRKMLKMEKLYWKGRWIISLIQNEGKTDNRKTMITFLSDDFKVPSKSRICEYQLWNQPIRTQFIFNCGLILVWLSKFGRLN